MKRARGFENLFLMFITIAYVPLECTTLLVPLIITSTIVRRQRGFLRAAAEKKAKKGTGEASVIGGEREASESVQAGRRRWRVHLQMRSKSFHFAPRLPSLRLLAGSVAGRELPLCNVCFPHVCVLPGSELVRSLSLGVCVFCGDGSALASLIVLLQGSRYCSLKPVGGRM